MDNIKRKGEGRENFRWKKFKQESGRLKLGTRGLLITNSISGKYKEAMQEILTILRQHAEEHYPLDDKDDNEMDDVSMEELLDRGRMSTNKEFNRFVPGSCISKCLNLVYFINKDDLPSKYVQEIFNEINNNNTYSARFLSRIIPIDHICYANYDAIESILSKLIAREFNRSNAKLIQDEKIQKTNSNNNTSGDTTIVDRGDDNIQHNEDVSYTWAMEYRCSNSNALDREMVLDMLVRMIGDSYKVDLKRPDKLIIIYVVKGLCGMSIISEYSKIAHFKLNVSHQR